MFVLDRQKLFIKFCNYANANKLHPYDLLINFAASQGQGNTRIVLIGHKTIRDAIKARKKASFLS